MKFAGRTALVTGSCGEGMGRSTALRLAREGANIVLNYGTHRCGKEIQSHAEKIAETIRELQQPVRPHGAGGADEERRPGRTALADELRSGVLRAFV